MFCPAQFFTIMALRGPSHPARYARHPFRQEGEGIVKSCAGQETRLVFCVIASGAAPPTLGEWHQSMRTPVAHQAFFNLEGQVAVVTGAGQGIGEAIARRLAAAGARVAALDLREELAQRVASALGTLGIACDVASAPSVQKAIEHVHRELGPVDILVNNAGITGRTLPLWQLEESDLDRVYAVNLKGVFLTCRAIINSMISRRYGRIVNVASVAGKEGNPTLIPYSSTKAAVICLTKALAKEVTGKGDITVNSISPAVVRTTILDTMSPETVAYMVSKIPVRRTASRRDRGAGPLPCISRSLVHHRPVL